MAYKIGKVDVWAGDIPNRPGTLAGVLDALRKAGSNLEFMIARKASAKTSRVFVAPIRGAKQQRAAKAAGLAKARKMHSVRIEGPNRRGLGARITRAIAEQGVNLRGASAAGMGKNAVFYLAVESAKHLNAATRAVRALLK